MFMVNCWTAIGKLTPSNGAPEKDVTELMRSDTNVYD